MVKKEYTRQAVIHEGSVVVFDDLLPAMDLAVLGESLKVGHFSKTEFARQETFQYKHWVCEIGLDQIRRMSLYRAALTMVERYFPKGKYSCFRSYCNLANYGDMLMIHRDCDPAKRNVVTALWYVCHRWEPDWGGETLFFNENGDAEFVVTPKPGRLVVFDGAIQHVGRPPNRICYEPRFTLALKFLRED